MKGAFVAMGQECFFTGVKPVVGNQYTHRGKAKYLGGVGRKVTGKSKRKFKPNLQRVKCVVNGQVMTVRASVKAIRMGLVVKPVVRKAFDIKSIKV
jgi:large subunit ribosomal protein L28